ncbi:MAG TPA: GDSL-type esterase/lipase family protein [Bacteroidales bacterium]|nr:GDSL-type esterase/lipase family protein [Bacteroidales bacterium]
MRCNRIIILLIFLPILIHAQNVYNGIAEYPFIDTSKNKLIFPNSQTTTLDNFFSKMDSLIFTGEGNINIIHMGGSHVQADVFSNKIRENLMQFYPSIVGSRGLIFPYKIAKTNNPKNYYVSYGGEWSYSRNVNKYIEYSLGASGIVVATQDASAYLSIKLQPTDTNIKYSSTIITLLGHSENNSMEPLIVIDDTTAYTGTYDSIHFCYRFELDNPTDEVMIQFLTNDSIIKPFVLRGIIWEPDQAGISYHSIGVNGASTISYLKCELLENDIELLKPDLIIFAIGINDAAGTNFSKEEFINNYSTLIDKIKAVAPNVSFIFVTNNDSYKRYKKRYYVNKNGLIAREAFYELANKYNGAVWDLFDIMGGLSSMKQWESVGLAQHDKIHFTAIGYNLIGDLFYNALISEYLKYLSENSKIL